MLGAVYINDIPDDITSLCKIFADDKCLFSPVHDENDSANEPNADSEKISQWVYQ